MALVWNHPAQPYRYPNAVGVLRAKCGVLVAETYVLENDEGRFWLDVWADSPIVGQPDSGLIINKQGPYATNPLASAAADTALRSLRDQMTAVLGSTPPK